MQWYHNKKSMPLVLENCHVPLALGNCYIICSSGKQSHFIHFFFFSFCRSVQVSSGVAGATSPFHRHLSPHGMFNVSLLRKRSFSDSWLLASVPLRNTLDLTPQT